MQWNWRHATFMDYPQVDVQDGHFREAIVTARHLSVIQETSRFTRRQGVKVMGLR
jgi:hypothetical protein